jgi:hypothetical protein
MDFNYMPMQPIQIAMSGVIPGKYGNSKQIPTFNVDQRGRLTFAADVNIEPNLQIVVDDDPRQNRTLNLNVDAVRFQSGDGVNVKLIDHGIIEFSLDNHTISQLIKDSEGSKRIVDPVIDTIKNFVTVDNTGITVDYYTQPHGILKFGTPSSKVNLVVNSLSDIPGVDVRGQITGDAGLKQLGPSIKIAAMRGTLRDPESLTLGDLCGSLQFSGMIPNRDNDPEVGDLVSIRAVITEVGNSTIKSKAKLQFVVANHDDPLNSKMAEFDVTGVFSAPVIQVGVHTSNNHPAPAKGMIIFNDSTNTFQGYNGNAWVNLG